MVYRAPHYAAFFGAVLWLVAMDPRRVAFAQGPNPHGLYVPPAPTFIHDRFLGSSERSAVLRPAR